MRKEPRKKIFVGMSGGVDSSVSAALLKKAGHDVIGVFIKVWQPDWIECNWREERRDAMRAAAHLGIPFVTLDLEAEYKKGVIDYMIAEYAIGRTPNPDVMCNREVKFGAFWKWAEKEGADFIATGHYARISISDKEFNRNPKAFCGPVSRPAGRAPASRSPSLAPITPLKTSGLRFQLLAGIDQNKDQSYFLWTLNQNDLRHVLFPVGNFEKSHVRVLAKKFGLPNADKKDSQGLCFIGKVDVKEFLRHYVKTEPGKVLDEAGQTIGTHPGALLFTIGERRGFEINADHKTSHDKAYYVVAKNTHENTITVSNKVRNFDLNNDSHATTDLESGADINKAAVNLRTVKLSQVNWIGEVPKVGGRIQARARYREPLAFARIVSIANKSAVIEFEKPKDTITPGQSLVMYDGKVCMGGGIIET